MEVVNPFILKNKIGMVKFIDELCKVDTSDLVMLNDNDGISLTDGNNNNGVNKDEFQENMQNPAQDLAVVHGICESHKNELELLATSSQAAKRLVTILSILSQHKQYYSNLRRNANQSNQHQSTNTTTLV